MKLRRLISVTAATCLVLGLVVAVTSTSANAGTGALTRYTVVFKATQDRSGNYQLGGNYAKYRDAAIAAVKAAGGTIVQDLSKQIAVIVVESNVVNFADQISKSSLVDVAAQDFKWKAFPTFQEAIQSGQLTIASGPPPGGLPGGPEQTQDTFETEQWSMINIRAPQAHNIQAGSRLVEVGILDTGIESTHPDFQDPSPGGPTNVNCAKGRDFIPAGPGVGLPPSCLDNNFHGTHVAGIVAAQANGVGVVGVAPNVELIPVKVCDAAGFCYSASSAAAITYAGDMKFEVINMSYFVDDDVFLESTQFKCMSDPVQRAFRQANERAMRYARNQGVVPVAALGNSDADLAHPPEPFENECEVVPAETDGVIGTMALGRFNEKATYSSYGVGATDVAAPGGNFGVFSDEPNEFCEEQVLSTVPAAFGTYGCFQGTSMASPHTAGVAALIVSQFGRVGTDAGETDVVLRPQQVENYLQSTVVDQGEPGYDECFGNGRIDALRAVQHDTSRLYDPTAPPCPEYAE